MYSRLYYVVQTMPQIFKFTVDLGVICEIY
jgi:hypothetical protein